MNDMLSHRLKMLRGDYKYLCCLNNGHLQEAITMAMSLSASDFVNLIDYVYVSTTGTCLVDCPPPVPCAPVKTEPSSKNGKTGVPM